MIKREQGYIALSFCRTEVDKVFNTVLIYKWGNNKRKIRLDKAIIKLPVIGESSQLGGITVKWGTSSDSVCTIKTLASAHYDYIASVENGFIVLDVTRELACALKDDKNLVLSFSSAHYSVPTVASAYGRSNVTVFYESQFYKPKDGAFKSFCFNGGALNVDVSSGSQTIALSLVKGRGNFPIDVELNYASLAHNNDGFCVLSGNGATKRSGDYKCGKGWKLNYQQYVYIEKITDVFYDKMVRLERTSKRYIWVRGDGSQIAFDEKYYGERNGKREWYFCSLGYDDGLKLKGCLLDGFSTKKIDVKREIEEVDGYTLTAPVSGINGCEAFKKRVVGGKEPQIFIQAENGALYGFSSTNDEKKYELVYIKDANDNEQKLSYNACGQLVKIISDSEAVTIEYNADGNVAKVLASGGGAVCKYYGGADLCEVESLSDKSAKARFYFSANRLKAFCGYDGAGYCLDYDAVKCKRVQKAMLSQVGSASGMPELATVIPFVGNIRYDCAEFIYLSERLVRVSDADNDETVTYGFDALGRVIAVCVGGNTSNSLKKPFIGGKAYPYAYDGISPNNAARIVRVSESAINIKSLKK